MLIRITNNKQPDDAAEVYQMFERIIKTKTLKTGFKKISAALYLACSRGDVGAVRTMRQPFKSPSILF